MESPRLIVTAVPNSLQLRQQAFPHLLFKHSLFIRLLLIAQGRYRVNVDLRQQGAYRIIRCVYNWLDLLH
jgi:hypothetical protein